MDQITPPPGRRKDGLPYAPNNTRDDGSFIIGKGRTDPKTRFAVGDGRQRGRRVKGTKNLATDWAEELAERITITEGGKKKRVTKQRALVKATIARAMSKSDRAAEIAYRHAAIEPGGPKGLAISDEEILSTWLAQRAAGSSDDLPEPHAGVKRGEESSDDYR